MTSTYPTSYYADTVGILAQQASLKGEVSVDVAIVGSGYTGLSAALHLLERGYSVAVLEAHRIAWGASGRNGGQLGSTQREDQESLEARLGKDHARRMWDLAREANRLVRELINRHDIECDLRDGAAHLAWKKSHARSLRNEVDFMEQNYPDAGLRYLELEEVRDLVASERYHGGVFDPFGAHLHPLAYALGLARAVLNKGGRVYEGTRILSREGTKLRTQEGKVNASVVLLACNGYLDKIEPRIAPKIMPLHNFIVATEPLGERARQLIQKDYAISDSKFVIDYYRRTRDGRLLFGGGETYSTNFPEDIAGFVRKPMLRVFPQLADTRIDYAWGGTLAITMPRIPHFGRIDENVFFAQGYSGSGIHMATLAGKLLAEAAAGQSERFDVLASIRIPDFPGGTLLRYPMLVFGMLYYSLRDKI